ncbi:hypothetical protein [Actinomycetospora aeridis]|uniref:Uncharacterized protein n=1 Tax=Actinomycetospora aeridis TaxID=3129231 RepID=A0ABU8NDH9_9PSEU
MTTIAQHLDAAAENIRQANHASREPVTRPDAYAVVGSLAELVHRLSQLLDYLARGLGCADPADHYDDRGHDPIGALLAAQDDLRAADAAARTLAGHLDHAHNHLGHLGRRITED